MRIVISEFMDSAAVTALSARFAVLYDEKLVERRSELRAQLGDAVALIVRNRTQVDADLLASAPRLKVVGRLGVGLDNIDTAACMTRRVEVIPATGANAQAVAEYVIGVAMVLLRTAYLSTSVVADGAWPRQSLSEGREIAGKTMGLVGFGGIGRLTARLARAVGMDVIGFDPQLPASSPVWAAHQARPRMLSEVLAESDIISLHVPLTHDTKDLIDASRIAQMKPDAILINTARGGVVDESAVARALRVGRLGGAALDVFDREPLLAGSPLAGCPRLLLTPHIAGLTRESNERVSSMVAEKVAAALSRNWTKDDGPIHDRGTAQPRRSRVASCRRQRGDGRLHGARTGRCRGAGARLARLVAHYPVHGASAQRPRRRRCGASRLQEPRRRDPGRCPRRACLSRVCAGGRRCDRARAPIRRRVRGRRPTAITSAWRRIT